MRRSLFAIACLLGGLLVGLTIDRAWFRSTEAIADQNPINQLESISHQLAEVSKLTTGAVVHIQAVRQTKRGEIEETGSGVIVTSEKGNGYYVVTNRHVVDSTPLENIDIQVSDGRSLHPTKTWTDKESDLAVLKLGVSNLTPARWGDSESVRIGNIVLAVGSPFGLNQSVTMGIISAMGRRSLELGPNSEVLNQDFLQTDAAINPGNSGGPLMNLRGEVIGINTAIASRSGSNEGIAFCIPSHIARKVVDDLIEFGRVPRAYLGVKLDPVFNLDKAKRLKLDKIEGARVVDVYPDTPAYSAKLKTDDVILRLNGVKVQDETHLINMVSLLPIEKQVKLEIFREGKKVEVTVTLGDRSKLHRSENPITPDMGTPVPQLGLTLHPIDRETARELGYPGDTVGLLVLKVEAPGPLSRHVKLYDVIEEIDRSPIQSVSDLDQIIEERGVELLSLRLERIVRGKLESRLIDVRLPKE